MCSPWDAALSVADQLQKQSSANDDIAIVLVIRKDNANLSEIK